MSTCVSVTAFNAAGLSRVVTEATRVVIVIHEWGYVGPDLAHRVADWRDRGIYVIEDCAHVCARTAGDQLVGAAGDAVLYSLPKVIPAPAGGLLRTRERRALPRPDGPAAERTAAGAAAARAYLGRCWLLNQWRQDRHHRLAARLPVVDLSADAVPWATPVALPATVREAPGLSGVEWVATLRPDRVVVPTNPLVPLEVFDAAASALSAHAAAGVVP